MNFLLCPDRMLVQLMSRTCQPVVAQQSMQSRNERKQGNEWKSGGRNERKNESLQSPSDVMHAFVLLPVSFSCSAFAALILLPFSFSPAFA